MPTHPLTVLRFAALALTLTACAAQNGSGAQNRDTQTIHNPDATHVWAFQKDPAGNDFVLYCDSGWPASGRPLCVRYPSAFGTEAAPSSPPVTVQLVQPAPH